jgi:hypothetical protein
MGQLANTTSMVTRKPDGILRCVAEPLQAHMTFGYMMFTRLRRR